MSDPLAALRGNVAVITGAGSGIGEGLAHCAAAAGMQVVVADIAADRAESVVDAICQAGGDATAMPVDVASPESIDALAKAVHKRFGSVTMLFNNAGVETVGFSWELSSEQWEKTLQINIHGAIHGVRAFAPGMLASGRRAWIANTCSIGGLGMMPLQTSYILSKHAMISYSECLFLEMQLKGAPIHVSAILPGPVATRIFADGGGGQDEGSVQHRALMDAMLHSDGISGMEAAQRIFPQVVAGAFWVSTHPEVTQQMAAGRAQHLSTLSTPALPAEILASMGLAVPG